MPSRRERAEAPYGWSAGAIATTPTDLVNFARALFDGTLLDDTAIAQLTDRSAGGEHTLGLVPFEQHAWGHNGGAPGYQAVYVHQPNREVTAALFTNCPTCADRDTRHLAGRGRPARHSHE